MRVSFSREALTILSINKLKLDSGWSIDIDPLNKGKLEGWFSRGPSEEARPIQVPGIIQEAFPEYHGVAWYWYHFRLGEGSVFSLPTGNSERCCLHFGAVDYYAEVWLNGVYLGYHEGGESAFELDCTEAIAIGGNNVLAVRVINPTHDSIDGFVLKETPHTWKKLPYEVGGVYNHGGIVLPVELRVVPAVKITDVFAAAQCDNGQVKLAITCSNSLSRPFHVRISARVGGTTASDMAVESFVEAEVLLFPGTMEIEVEAAVSQPRLWSLEDPYLYAVTVEMEAYETPRLRHQYTSRFGFRDFRVDEEGFFRLNGKRIFVKSSHTINHFPIGQRVPYQRDLMTRDLLFAKAAGFNMIRFIAGMPYPEQLDYCDQIGLLVYEECYAAWDHHESPHMAERYDRSTEQMVRRDRNHPSVVIWGLLNERLHGPVFRQAVDILPRLRQWDPTRLALLSSGRWDGEYSIGTASNPGIGDWQHVWGADSADAPTIHTLPLVEDWFKPGIPGGYVPGAGDAHIYAQVPHERKTVEMLRTLGHSGKPVYLSEYGIGSQVDAIRVIRRFEQEGARDDLEDFALYRTMADSFLADWKRYGMEDVYPFPEDMLEESQRLGAGRRLQGFNAIRSNPRLCGYNLTGTVDQGMAGEGLWTTWRDLKPGIMDVLRDGWAPLRWCLFASPTHVYRGQPFTIEAVLANEGVLGDGIYPVLFRLSGPDGTVWEKSAEAVITADNRDSFAIPVLLEEVAVDGSPGVYQLSAVMEQGGCPAGGKLNFHISDSAAPMDEPVSVALLGIDAKVEQWLVSKGVHCRDYRSKKHSEDVNEIIVVGNPDDRQFDPEEWTQLFDRIRQGAQAIFLQHEALFPQDGTVGRLPFDNKGKAVRYVNTLYHKEDIARKHAIFAGLQAGGIMDWDYYDQIIPEYIIENLAQPDETIAAGFAVGYPCPGGYFGGIVTAEYAHSSGSFIVNTLKIVENLDDNPAADRLLLNLIRYAKGRGKSK